MRHSLLYSALTVVLFGSMSASARLNTGIQSSLPVASNNQVVASNEDDDASFLDEFDPASPDAEAILRQYDRYYYEMTGESPYIGIDVAGDVPLNQLATCRRATCPLWIRVNKATQTAQVFLDYNTTPLYTWLTSSGMAGHTTPNFDKHPDGRIYNKYSSRKFPGGDYNGLGNMPYAVFIKGGYAIHGTPKSNWPKLGKVASHGCIRIHPENARIFNQLVRSYGVNNVWITVE